MDNITRTSNIYSDYFPSYPDSTCPLYEQEIISDPECDCPLTFPNDLKTFEIPTPKLVENKNACMYGSGTMGDPYYWIPCWRKPLTPCPRNCACGEGCRCDIMLDYGMSCNVVEKEDDCPLIENYYSRRGDSVCGGCYNCNIMLDYGMSCNVVEKENCPVIESYEPKDYYGNPKNGCKKGERETRYIHTNGDTTQGSICSFYTTDCTDGSPECPDAPNNNQYPWCVVWDPVQEKYGCGLICFDNSMCPKGSVCYNDINLCAWED